MFCESKHSVILKTWIGSLGLSFKWDEKMFWGKIQFDILVQQWLSTKSQFMLKMIELLKHETEGICGTESQKG